MDSDVKAIFELCALVRAKEAEAEAAAEEARAKEAQLAKVRGILKCAESGGEVDAEVYLEVAQASCGKTLTPHEKQMLEIKKKSEEDEKAWEKDREARREERDIARQKRRAQQDKEAEERRAHREAKEDKDRAHEKARELKRVKEDEDWEAEFAAALRDRSAKRLKKLADAEATEQNSGEFH